MSPAVERIEDSTGAGTVAGHGRSLDARPG